MIFVERRSGKDRRKQETKSLIPEKERRTTVGGRRLTDRLQKIKVDENDFFVFRIFSMTDTAKNSALEISKFFREKGSFVVFAPPSLDIEKFNENQMNKIGWYRRDDS